MATSGHSNCQKEPSFPVVLQKSSLCLLSAQLNTLAHPFFGPRLSFHLLGLGCLSSEGERGSSLPKVHELMGAERQFPK